MQRPELAAPLRQSLPAAWSVRVGATQHVQVSTAGLQTELRRIEQKPAEAKAAIAEIEARLAILRSAANELAAAEKPGNSPEAVANLNHILERPEFEQEKGLSPLQLWIRHAARWLAEKIFRGLSLAHLRGKNGNYLAWTIIGAAFVLLGIGVWRRLRRAAVAAEHHPEKAAPTSDTRQWIAEALAAAERGDFREAVHCGYWAAIASLEDHRLLERDRARTPRESLRLLREHPTQQKMLGELTRHFELIWYGCRPASQQDWSGARILLEKMGCLKPSTATIAGS